MKTEAGSQNKQKRNSKTNRPMNRKVKTEEPLKNNTTKPEELLKQRHKNTGSKNRGSYNIKS